MVEASSCHSFVTLLRNSYYGAFNIRSSFRPFMYQGFTMWLLMGLMDSYYDTPSLHYYKLGLWPCLECIVWKDLILLLVLFYKSRQHISVKNAMPVVIWIKKLGVWLFCLQTILSTANSSTNHFAHRHYVQQLFHPQPSSFTNHVLHATLYPQNFMWPAR